MGFCGFVFDTFFGVCSALALTVTTVTEFATYALHLNYSIVTNVYATACTVLSGVAYVIDCIIQTVVFIFMYVFDFLQEVFACVIALLVLLWHICVLTSKVFCLIFTGLESICVGILNGGVFLYSAICCAAKALGVSCVSKSDYFATLTQDAIAFVCSVLTYVGHFSKAVVIGIWYCLGYIPATIACIPEYVRDCLSKISLRIRMFSCSAFMNVNRDTYLGFLIVYLVCLAIYKIIKHLHNRGMTLFPFTFSLRRRPRNRQQGRNEVFAFDRGFESDLDIDDVDEGSAENEIEGYDDNDDSSDDAGSDTQTELTLSDNDSDSDSTVGSDSDVSLNSQTFSSENEDEIDIQLPAVRSQMPSRSSTPSRNTKDMNHEEFEREIERERERRKCVVCQDLNKSVLVLPCRHMCLCVVCANRIIRSEFFNCRICPLCRGRIESVINVYV